MPRLFPNQVAKCVPAEEALNDCVSNLQTEVQHYVELQQQTSPDNKTSRVDYSDRSEIIDNSTKEASIQKIHEQQIHTIYSSDEEGALMEQNTIEEEITTMSSAGSGDFEGFDDYSTPNNSCMVNDTSRENLNVSANCLKRHSEIDFKEDHVDSEDGLECNEEIVINKDGKMVYRTVRQITPKKANQYNSESYTTNKRKKSENEHCFDDFLTTQLKTPPDQIVEVNSDSTTNSLKQKRQQINTKFQLNLCQQNYKANNYPNKCSSESTSEFPVSSPSNPQQPRGGKYPTRPPLLKNTLPADSFERQLSIITQMTLGEKIQTWDCEDETSDLEDVRKFDDVFKRIEKQKKLEMKQNEKGRQSKKCSELKSYDFSTFRQMIIDNIKSQKYKRNNVGGQGVSGNVGLSGIKCVESSESESSKSVVHVDDRPSTSAVAQQQLQRRSKPQLYFETGEPKKRILKNIPKRKQNSTTPPQTSSSDNERDCFKKSNHNVTQRQIHIHDKLICPSSSEEAASQDVPAQEQLKMNRKHGQVELKKKRNRSPVQTEQSVVKKYSNEKKQLPINNRIITDEEVESFFRPHRLNREIDKFCGSLINEAEDQSAESIIQMRLDCSNDKADKKQDLFKTPIIPQKYLPNSLFAAEYQKPNNSLSTKVENSHQEIKAPWSNENTLTKNEDIIDKQKEIKSTFDDFDGIYHQQHEFCNYLGLTGMSTATAMANAVAELAQCNLARRSMRVFRQQQQERRDKTAKEERNLKALKLKQLKEVRKREGRKNETELKVDPKNNEGSQSEESEPLSSLKQPQNKKRNNSTAKSQKSLKIIKDNPEIKILCHIAAKDTIEVEKLSSECNKEITTPIRENIICQAKQINCEKSLNVKAKIDAMETKTLNEMTDNSEEVSVKMKETLTRTLRSPSLSIGNHSHLKSTRSRSQLLCNLNEKEDNCTTPDPHTVEKRKLTGGDSNNELKPNENSQPYELSTISSNAQLISSQPSIMQKKIQMALEESRKTKPSIFIVQSLETKNEKLNNINNKCIISPKNDNATAPQNTYKKGHDFSTKYNKNNCRKVFKKSKCKKYPLPKRKLRKRKIIVIKASKPKLKTSYQSFNEFKRELRSSPRYSENKKENSLVGKNTGNLSKQSPLIEKTIVGTKSFRTVHTETKDLETYLHANNSQAKTRLMAKASALLERSKRMTLRNKSNLVNNKTHKTKIQRKQISKPKLGEIISQRLRNRTSENKQKDLMKQTSAKHTKTTTNTLSKKQICLESETVVVSSTTNTFDERPANESVFTQSLNISTLVNTATLGMASSPIQTKNQSTQCNSTEGVHYLSTSPSPLQSMRNPLKTENGAVFHIYHELEILIVIQERLVSFWKCSKLINMLIKPRKLSLCPHQTVQSTEATFSKHHVMENCCSHSLARSVSSPTIAKFSDYNEWIQLGEIDRLNQDFEISVPFANRLCLHNSTPIYLEMRAQHLPKNQRDCNLLSMYINIYYYHEEEMIAKRNSIQLDSIQSDVESVNYTTLIDSRYFIITWPQENLLGKTRSGLCKYSLTPQLDTLASIREFKSMRHTIRYLECIRDDKLIGFGETQLTIWDYRSGDVLMNYDLEIPMGKNLGSIYFPSPDIDQNNMLILHQYRHLTNNCQSELVTISCSVTHAQPSYKVLQETCLPLPAFKVVKSAIKTADHLVITGQDGDEIWISSANPRLMTVIPRLQHTQRFYGRERSQLIELTDETLNVNSLTNHLLQLAAG